MNGILYEILILIKIISTHFFDFQIVTNHFLQKKIVTNQKKNVYLF